MMLAELRELFTARPATGTLQDYRHAVLDDNALGKRTRTARRNTFGLLAELFVLDREVAIFRLFRHYWDVDAQGRPLLALLCAAARDPMLRLSAGPVLGAQ